MAARAKRRGSAVAKKKKASRGSGGGRRAKPSTKGAAGKRSRAAPARKSAPRRKATAKESTPPPQPDIQEESGATVYLGRTDVPHPGAADSGERLDAEDHSSPRSRLHDGSESVVRTSEETAIAERSGPARRAPEAEGPGEAVRTSDERSGTSGPAGAYFEDTSERLDERRSV